MNIRKALLFAVAVLSTAACEQARQAHMDRAEPPPQRLAQKRAPYAAAELGAAPAGMPAAPDALRTPAEALDRERYGHYEDNPVKLALEHPVSTFSIDVDTGAYANVRRLLNAGRLPPRDAVRIEEMINYFGYAYASPARRETPFSVSTALAPAPWHADRHLLRIGIQGYRLDAADLPPANLVFLVDVSGSMQSADKLPLLKSALGLLARRLRPEDRVSIVVYAGASGVVLAPTAGDRGAEIAAALDRLQAGGSTNGAAGIRLAYALAREAYVEGGINRILLATDGDFNVGTVDFEQLKNLVEREREHGVSLTTLGFGTGNYNEHLMEQLADAGNGNYAYIDSLREANKVLVSEMAGTLATIAKDVKIQVEFNPDQVAEYRLIGYENRVLRREDFNNDRIDAGEIGAGHSVTALYELTFTGSGAARIDERRYAKRAVTDAAMSGEIAFLRVRYKAPDGDESELLEWPIMRAQALERIAEADEDFRFATAVAAFGQLLRGGRYTERFDYADVLELAASARGDDASGHRAEFTGLVELARRLSSARSSAGGGANQIAAH
ncbi:MAG: VWA domain-containing protein [Gammaproteobacteria bacterium]|nr:VWA domain-containing protein [Gammaproteobacteria bacterium]